MTTRTIEILLVEDNSADAELILESLGREYPIHLVHIAHDGVEALDFLLCRGTYSDRSFDTPPRLIVLDIKLPKIDGLEVLRELKTNPHTRTIPVVMLTSSNIERDVARAYREGANSYIQKPVDFAHFREVVRTLGHYWLRVNEMPPLRAHAEEDR